ncbi:MAG: MBL fold metallo-hydrolase [Phycisphaeraceae bacterium]|nr:MBL fold metallo-hydrolase [Phycisphaeraceae bacterium]
MRLVFLGTGTSSGVPAIACSCAVCTSTDPRDNRLRAGAAICFTDATGQDRTILIDATPDLRLQALRAGLQRCDAVVFTHNHVDHTFGVDELRRFNVVQKSAIDIYAEPHTLEHLRRVYRHIFEPRENIQDTFVATLTPRTLEVGRALSLFGVRFEPLRLMHGQLPIVGFRIEQEGAPDSGAFPLAYCTDVSAIPDETWPRLTGLRTLVLNALRHRRHSTHFSVQEAVAAAQRIGAGRTYFTHISHDLAHAATNAELPAGLALAYDGQIIE